MNRKAVILVVCAAVAAAVSVTLIVMKRDIREQPVSPAPVVAPTPSAADSVSATPLPSGTPTTPPPADMTQLSEPAGAAAVEDAAADADAAAAAAAQTAASSAGDGELSAEEAAALAAATSQAEALVEYAIDTAAAYEDVYSEATGDLMSELDQLESELAVLSEDLAAVLAYLEKGEAAAQEAADRLADAAGSAGLIRQAAADWSGQLAGLCEQRVREAAGTHPTQVSGTRRGAAESLRAYVDTVKDAVGGGLSEQDISRVSQAGANAAASLQQAGGALAGLSGQVESLTGRLAGGDLPGVREGLSQLEQAIP